MNHKNYITASEIGDYVYCPRGWWLHQQAVIAPTPQMIQGTRAHNALAFRLILSPKLKIIGFLLIGIGFLFFVLLLKLLI